MNPINFPEKYILLPNKLKVGVVDSYGLRFGRLDLIYTNLIEYEIKNFRPKTTFISKELIYLTEDRINKLTSLFKKNKLIFPFYLYPYPYGLADYRHFDERTLFDLKWLESPPNIVRIIMVKNSDEFIVSYRIRNETIDISVKKINNKWIKLKELEHSMSNLVS